MTQIYNLIILDESGSMSGVTAQTISGCNETIQTIRATQEQFQDSQQHFISIYVFQSGRPSRYLFKNVSAAAAVEVGPDDYQPYGGTPLNDAVGGCLADMKACIWNKADAIGSVTIITDGYENSSCHYSISQIVRMIDEMKERGWNFNFIGANIDVVKTASAFNIDNSMEFTCDPIGAREMFEKERNAKMDYMKRMKELDDECNILGCDHEERMRRRKELSSKYYDKGINR